MNEITQNEVNEACEAAYQRFSAMPPETAVAVFTYTLTGFTKCMVKNGLSLTGIRHQIIELLDLLEKANGPVQ